MLKINAPQFKKLLIGQSVFKNNIIPVIEDKFIREIPVKGRFFYSLQNSPELPSIHSNIINDILNKIEINNSACAYVSKKSYLDFFTSHIGNFNFVRFDIRNFFHSIDAVKLKEMLSNYFEDDYIDIERKQLIIDSFMNLVTYKLPPSSKNKAQRGDVILPIGFATSPIISNIYMRDFDIKIQEYCIRLNINYSRYADDMLFSSGSGSEFIFSDSFMKEVAILLGLKGLHLNTKKTVKRKHTISLNGYTISNNNALGMKNTPAFEFRISNKKLYILKKFIHLSMMENINSRKIMEKLFSFNLKNQKFLYPPKDKFIESYCHTLLVNKIIGYRSYLISIIKYSTKNNVCNDSMIEKYTKLLNALDAYLDKNPCPVHSKVDKS